jgi:hypothetical protein
MLGATMAGNGVTPYSLGRTYGRNAVMSQKTQGWLGKPMDYASALLAPVSSFPGKIIDAGQSAKKLYDTARGMEAVFPGNPAPMIAGNAAMGAVKGTLDSPMGIAKMALRNFHPTATRLASMIGVEQAVPALLRMGMGPAVAAEWAALELNARLAKGLQDPEGTLEKALWSQQRPTGVIDAGRKMLRHVDPANITAAGKVGADALTTLAQPVEKLDRMHRTEPGSPVGML